MNIKKISWKPFCSSIKTRLSEATKDKIADKLLIITLDSVMSIARNNQPNFPDNRKNYHSNERDLIYWSLPPPNRAPEVPLIGWSSILWYVCLRIDFTFQTRKSILFLLLIKRIILKRTGEPMAERVHIFLSAVLWQLPTRLDVPADRRNAHFPLSTCMVQCSLLCKSKIRLRKGIKWYACVRSLNFL